MIITGGYLNSRKIKTAESENVKPTLSKTRQGIFNSLSSLITFENKSFLDLFAGSAIMSFEAVSRGFENVSAVEKDKKTALCIKKNIKDLDVNVNLFFADAVKFLSKNQSSFNVIFIDPPYDSGLYDKVLNIISFNSILSENGIVILEHLAEKKINLGGFEIIKQKTYADKCITFIQKCNKL